MRAWALLVALAALSSACTGCSHDGASPVDAGAPDSAKPKDAAVDAKDSGWAPYDGGIIQDWAGWRRLTELDPVCNTDVPLSPSALPKFNWIPCVDGRPKCEEIDTAPLRPTKAIIYFGNAWSIGGNRIAISRYPSDDEGVGEIDILDLTTNETVYGVRFGGTGQAVGCPLAVTGNANELRILAYAASVPGIPYELGRRKFADLWTGTTDSPWVFKSLGLPFNGNVAEETSMSADIMGFDIQPAGSFAYLPFESTTPASTAGIRLTNPQAVGSDLFGVETGNGWRKLIRVKPDGSTLVFRAVPQHTVSTPASDGITMYWTECYGKPNPNDWDQPNVELWSAPYTNDPAVLATTATKAANLGTTCVYNQQQLAMNGVFSAVSGLSNFIYRKSDGKTVEFKNGTGTRGEMLTWYPIRVTEQEYWSVEGVRFGARGIALTRMKLDPW